MPSPFPGMNPYLEQADLWQDFHSAMIPAIRAAITPQVGDRYRVKIEQQLYIHEQSADDRLYFGRSDVGIAATPEPRPAASQGGMVTAPVYGQLLPAVDVERY